MDFIVTSSLLHRDKDPTSLIISYDIACQWSLYYRERMKDLPPHMQLALPDGPGELRYAIPKYHFAAHKEKGHNIYSLNLMKGAGRVCCEQIERTWPKHAETAASTREMGPGSRHDTLEDHFQYTNWRIYCSLGMFSVV